MLVCRLFEFLSQSSNPFESLFNMLDYFAEGFLLAETAAGGSGGAKRRNYKFNVLKLEMIATQLAEQISLVRVAM